MQQERLLQACTLNGIFSSRTVLDPAEHAMKNILTIAAATLIALSTPAALAQEYPRKPVRVIVPLGVGGTGDTLARTVGEEMGRILGTQLVIENRPGAGGLIGTESAASATPDGYTLLAVSPSHVITPALYARKTYDPLKSFEPITHMANTHQVIVAHPSLPVKNLKDLIALAKKHPGQLTYGSAGSGSATHLNMELFKSLAGVNIVHVPYKGSTQAHIDVMAGQVQLAMSGLLPMLPFIKQGRLRALGLTSSRRSQAAPDIPTIAEAGVPEYASDTWYGFLAPAQTPKDIVSTLNAAAVKALNTPGTRQRLISLGAEPVGSTPDEFRKLIAAEAKLWARVVKESGARVE
jgi:tripartite-type tricarboxylate transporter receptor subunit TctC